MIPHSGFDIEFLKKFRALILRAVKKGRRFILVVGGGATCRRYQAAARQVVTMTNEEVDYLGIKTTVLNAEFVRVLFKDIAHLTVITNPTKKIATRKPIIIAAGWKPGCSTDKDAVLLAKTYGAKEVINLSNIDYVYDRDPKKYPQAKKIKRTSWKEFRKIVGDTWHPGANVPFDPVAAKEAQRLRLTVKFARGTDLPAVAGAIEGMKIRGTIIK